jgi:hypothetical protein
MQRQYPEVITESELEGFFGHPHVIDLYDVILKKTDWPLSSYSIKDIAAYLGFRWRDKTPSGALSIEWYNEFLETRDPEVLARILRYNEDDCKAAMAVKDFLCRHCLAARCRGWAARVPEYFQARERGGREDQGGQNCEKAEDGKHELGGEGELCSLGRCRGRRRGKVKAGTRGRGKAEFLPQGRFLGAGLKLEETGVGAGALVLGLAFGSGHKEKTGEESQEQ